MGKIVNYEEHARQSMANLAAADAARQNALANSLGDMPIDRVLDLGCGAGQDLIPFLGRARRQCVGIDIADEIGAVTGANFANEPRAAFVRGSGAELPFADGSFDVVICLVALPYMNNRRAIAEAARVLKPDGVFLLKTHSPRFYFSMIRERLRTLNPKMLAYPVICLVAGIYHSLTGRQLETGFWAGKEIYQTRSFVTGECEKNGLEYDGPAVGDNPLSPSYRFVKAIGKSFLLLEICGGFATI